MFLLRGPHRCFSPVVVSSALSRGPWCGCTRVWSHRGARLSPCLPRRRGAHSGQSRCGAGRVHPGTASRARPFPIVHIRLSRGDAAARRCLQFPLWMACMYVAEFGSVVVWGCSLYRSFSLSGAPCRLFFGVASRADCLLCLSANGHRPVIVGLCCDPLSRSYLFAGSVGGRGTACSAAAILRDVKAAPMVCACIEGSYLAGSLGGPLLVGVHSHSFGWLVARESHRSASTKTPGSLCQGAKKAECKEVCTSDGDTSQS